MMLDMLWLLPTLPLMGFLVLGLAGARLRRRARALVAVSASALAAALALMIAAEFIAAPPTDLVFRQQGWTWLHIDSLHVSMGLYLDAVSLLMAVVVAVVGALIHLYATWYMADDPGDRRFFAYMNLFLAAMLTLVLADNLLLLFLGWEGVGLCSYLLIGHWYRNAANGYAARKAFVMTRVGDTALAVGLFLLFAQFNTLDIPSVIQGAADTWKPGDTLAAVAALCILAGAVGKSAQLPLQTWLPDAMAGPTPVSALLHAATMVTAGVYLVARMHGLFALAPAIEDVTAIIGAATLLLGATSAAAQTDIKRALAYSTMSQIGYMFLALGVGAWTGALFHFMTHAFFKALLFLAAGTIIVRRDGEHDLYRLGGTRQRTPLAFWTFTAGAASLAALPWVTAGFFSKEAILGQAWQASERHGFWLAAWLGAIITGFYAFRMVFLLARGQGGTAPQVGLQHRAALPLLLLSALAIGGGWFGEPLMASLATALPSAAQATPAAWVTGAAWVAPFIGLAIAAWAFVVKKPSSASGTSAARVWRAGWGIDSLYHAALVRPFQDLASLNRNDLMDGVYAFITESAMALHHSLSRSQDGRLRRYAAGIVSGAVLVIGVAVFT